MFRPPVLGGEVGKRGKGGGWKIREHFSSRRKELSLSGKTFSGLTRTTGPKHFCSFFFFFLSFFFWNFFSRLLLIFFFFCGLGGVVIKFCFESDQLRRLNHPV